MKNLIKRLVIAIVLILISFDYLWSEDVDLEKIVVTPSRIEEKSSEVSRNVDVITSRDIEASSAEDLAQVLTEITSVNISNYGGLGATKTIRMRGSSAAQVLVLVDGRPINNPRDGEVELSNIPLDNIDRIEVLHGPGSSLYGSGAMGGTVNIITKNPPKEKMKTELTSSFGTFRTYLERLSNGARISKFGYLVSGEYQSSQGFRDNAEFYAKDLNGKFEYKFAEGNIINLNTGYYRSDNGTPGPIDSPDIDDKQRNLKNFYDFNWDFKPNDSTGISTKIYQNYDRLEFMENTQGSAYDTANKKDTHTTMVRGYNCQLSKQLFDNYQGILGFNYVTNLNNSTTSAKHEYTVRAGYLDNQWDLFNDLKIKLGVRVDDYSNFGMEINPNLSFLYKLGDGIKLRGLFSRSFRAPTFNDLYWPDEGWAKGNPDLRPEKGLTGELGIDAKISKYILSSLTFYRNDFNDLINWAEEGGVWMPTNIDSAVIDGIEFSNKLYLTKDLESNIDYTFLRAKNDKTHKYLIYQPQHKIDWSLAYKNLDGFRLEVKGQFTDKRFHNANNTIKVKRFFVLSLNASKKFNNNFTYFVHINNLLNEDYQVIRNYPMPGFSITNGMKLEF